MEIELGPEPHRLTVPLFADAPYFAQLTVNPPLVAGESVDLQFGDGVVWLGTVSADMRQVTFSATAAAVNARLSMTDRSVRLRINDASGSVLWGVGQWDRGQAR